VCVFGFGLAAIAFMKKLLSLLPIPLSTGLSFVLSHPLLKGSAVLFIGSTFGNILAYAANMAWGRMLGPERYGVYAASLSLIYIASVFTSALNLSFSNFSARLKGNSEEDKVGLIVKNFLPGVSWLGLGGCLIFCLVTPFLSGFLNIPSYWPILLVGLNLGLGVVQTLPTGILQGLQKFKFMSIAGVLSGLARLAFGCLLIFIGFSYNGPLLGIIISSSLVFVLSLWILRDFFFPAKEEKTAFPFSWRDLFVYGQSAFFSSLGLMLLLATDTLLVKKFFSAQEAGLYSSAGVIARVILFVSGSVVTVMFSQVAERHSSNGKYRHVFWYSLALVGGFSLSISLFYFLFPAFMIRLFFSSDYFGAIHYLGWSGLFIALYSLVNVFVNFFLSIKKNIVSWLTLAAAFIQIVLIWFRHGSIIEVLQACIFANGLLLLVFLVYYFKDISLTE